jgi:CBS domain-containing protein
VVDCDGIVIGRLRGAAWDQDRSLRVEEVMELGPTTARANALLGPLVERMEKRGTDLVTVTTPQGVLVGVLLRTDASRLLTGESPEQIWIDCDGCPGRWQVR